MDYNVPFQPVNSTAPAFNSTLGTSTTGYQLESTGSTNRIWQGPSGRTVRITSAAANGDGVYVAFGTAATMAAATTDNILLMGQGPHILPVRPVQTHIAFRSSTSIAFNVTLGVGGG